MDSRQLILENAARLFRRNGYAATSLRAIASECGMQAGSLYYHFSSKEEIIASVLEIGVQRVFDAVRAAVDALPAGSGLQATLQAAVLAHLRGLLQSHDFTSANIRIFGQVPPRVRRAHLALRRAYEAYWLELLQGFQQRGAISPQRQPQLVEYFLFGAMNWATEWFDDKVWPVEAVADELTAVLVAGLQAGVARGEGA